MSDLVETTLYSPEINQRKIVKKSVSEVNLTFNLKYNSNEQQSDNQQAKNTTKLNNLFIYLYKFLNLFQMGFKNQKNLEFEVKTSYKKSELNLADPIHQDEDKPKNSLESQKDVSNKYGESLETNVEELVAELNNELQNKVLLLF